MAGLAAANATPSVAGQHATLDVAHVEQLVTCLHRDKRQVPESCRVMTFLFPVPPNHSPLDAGKRQGLDQSQSQDFEAVAIGRSMLCCFTCHSDKYSLSHSYLTMCDRITA